MEEKNPQFDFLIEYVLKLLEENNVSLSEEQKNVYVPQLLAQIEFRLGAELLPKLDEAQKKEFAKLAGSEETTSEQWKDFWYGAAPTFEEDIKDILVEFAQRVKQILASQ